VSLNEDNKFKEKKGPSRASRYKKTRRGCAKPVPRPQAKAAGRRWQAAGGRIRNNITSSNTYNFDKKDFLISLLRFIKRIVFIKSLKSKRTIGASQDESRKFITFIAAICADGSHVTLTFIY
jgi:hypothetical protein